MKRGYSLRPPVGNDYLVRERDRRRLRELGLVLLLAVPLGAVLLGYTWIHLAVLDAAYEIRELEGRLHELDRRERQLQLDAAYLASPRRLERWAVEAGMAPPRLEQTIFAAGGRLPEEDR